MSRITPFHGTLYNPVTVGNVADVVAPPYDVIDSALQRRLHARHPNNIVHLEFGLDQPGDGASNNKYVRAAGWLRDWLAAGVLRKDTQPALYFHTIEYRPPSGSASHSPRLVLKAFLATVDLEEFGSGHIYPHENTRAAAKTDRLHLLEACRTNLSPIFSLFSDPERRVIGLLEQAAAKEKPRIDFEDDSGSRQTLWAVTDPSLVDDVCEAMKARPLFIADGHHRYETALNYRRLRRQQEPPASRSVRQPYDQVMMLFASLEEPGLTVLPTHRVLTTPFPDAAQVTKWLEDAFIVTDFQHNRTSEEQVRRRFLAALRSCGQHGPTFGLATKDSQPYRLLELRPSHRPPATASPRTKLDVSILQHELIAKLCPTQHEQEAILYTKDDDEALNWVLNGTGTAALLLNATKVSEVQAVASAGERMPHKSTYFFPKPLTGLVINVFDAS